MAVYIIADLHLSESTTELNLAFESFVKRMLPAHELIIAGDLFDFFVGIDVSDRAQLLVRRTVSAAREAGLKISFQQGNRDFFIRKKEAAWFGFELLPEFHVLQPQWGRVLLTHGDALCSNDLKYQKFKQRCRNPQLQRLFMLLPLPLRRRIGRSIRQKSQNAGTMRLRDEKVYGVVPETIAELLQQYDCSHLVHGHLHHFQKRFRECPGEKSRLSLGAWGSNYSYVRIDEHGAALVQKPLRELIGQTL